MHVYRLHFDQEMNPRIECYFCASTEGGVSQSNFLVNNHNPNHFSFLNEQLNCAPYPNTGSGLEPESSSSVVMESPSSSVHPRPNHWPSNVKSLPNSSGLRHGVVSTRRVSVKPTWKSAELVPTRSNVPLLVWVLRISRRRHHRNQISVAPRGMLPWRKWRTGRRQTKERVQEKPVLLVSVLLRSPRMSRGVKQYNVFRQWVLVFIILFDDSVCECCLNWKSEWQCNLDQ